MKKMIRKSKSILAALMSFMVVLTMVPMFPMTALADGEENQNPPQNHTVRYTNAGAKVTIEMITPTDTPTSKVQYKFSEDGEWTDLGNGFAEVQAPNGQDAKIYVRAVEGDGEVLDNWQGENGTADAGRTNLYTEVQTPDGENVVRDYTYYSQADLRSGIDYAYTALTEGQSALVSVRFMTNNGGGGDPGNNGGDNPGNNGGIINGVIEFNIQEANDAMVLYSLDDGQNWDYVDVDTSQAEFAGNTNFCDVQNLQNYSSIKVKVELNNQSLDDFVDDNTHETFNNYETHQGGQRTEHHDLNRDLLSGEGVSIPYDYNAYSNDEILLKINIRFSNNNNQGGGEPEDHSTIKLVNVNDANDQIILFEDGQQTDANVPGITLSNTRNTPSLNLEGCNMPNYKLVISDADRVNIFVNGDENSKNSLEGIVFSEYTALEMDGNGYLSIGGGGIRGENAEAISHEERSEVEINGDIVLTVGSQDAPVPVAFKYIKFLRFKNYNFHERDKVNKIYADIVFEDVVNLEVISSKVDANATSKVFSHTDNNPQTNCVVFQEGKIISNGPDLGDVTMISRYYFAYPGSEQPCDGLGHDLIVWDCVKDVEIGANVPEAENKYSTEGSGANRWVLESLDPILYSVSYQIDEGMEEFLGGDPTKGSAELFGFDKGFFMVNGTGGRGEYWIAAGQTVYARILPETGYQYIKDSLNINGERITGAAPIAEKGVYQFVMGPHAGHMCAGFAETDNVVEIAENAPVKDAGIIGSEGDLIENGNIKLSVAAANPDEATAKKIEEKTTLVDAEVITLDLKLDEYVVKNYDPNASSQEAWETPLTELNGKVTLGIELPDNVDMESTSQVVRVHNGDVEVIPSEIDAMEIDGVMTYYVTFDTDRFSTYSIAYKAKYKILNGADQTLNVDGNDDLVIRASGNLADCTGIKVDYVLVDKQYYELTEGSTILRLKRTYLDTLKKGSHVVTFVYTDGEVSTNFVLQTKAASGAGSGSSSSSSSSASVVAVKDTVPKTGENNMMLIISLILAGASLAGIGVAITGMKRKKEE